MNDIVYSRHDFNLVFRRTQVITDSHELKKNSQGFSYLCLDLILGITDDDIHESMTDTEYLSIKRKPEEKGRDRGIDALYIDYDSNPVSIHIFNFKHTESFEKTKSNFPSTEIDKINGFLVDLISGDDNLKDTVNPVLADKVSQIEQLYNEHHDVKIVVHLCSNQYHGLVGEEYNRVEGLAKRLGYSVEEHTIEYFVRRMTEKGKDVINANIKLIDKNYFEKADGDVNALIANVDAYEILKAVSSSENIRTAVDLDSYEKLKDNTIHLDAFDDNVRIYLKQKSKINRNIKETALSNDSHRFFYFNNGITITCKSFEYTSNRRAPLVKLNDLQVVNGCQTIHALQEALIQDPNTLIDVNLLCRIYKTENVGLTNEIAEYTNSQNPVKSRDIRSNDFIQKVLEKNLKLKGYFYERKRNQFISEPLSKRVDAEKSGQALMAIFNGLPADAKTNKRIIFSDKYEEIFSDNLSDDMVITAFELTRMIHNKSAEARANSTITELGDISSFITHATYYILYTIGVIAQNNNVEINTENLITLQSYYEKAFDLLHKAAINEKNKNLKYNHRSFFISSKPKGYIEDAM